MDARLNKLITSKPLHWTEHVRFKMRQYGLSEARVKRVLRAPVRIEAGIAPKTVAVMQPAHPRHSEESRRGGATKNLSRMRGSRMRAGSPDASVGIPTLHRDFDFGPATAGPPLRMTKRESGHELWVMYEDTKKARKIIAAWRYPGVSPVREPPFPDDILAGR